MRQTTLATVLLIQAALTGCASIDFGGPGLTYFEPRPLLLVATAEDCVQTVSVVVIPAKQKVMKFNSGFGSSSLTASLENGMIASVGQTSDTKIPEILTGAAALAPVRESIKRTCEQKAFLYPIEEGKVLDAPVFALPPP